MYEITFGRRVNKKQKYLVLLNNICVTRPNCGVRGGWFTIFSKNGEYYGEHTRKN